MNLPVLNLVRSPWPGADRYMTTFLISINGVGQHGPFSTWRVSQIDGEGIADMYARSGYPFQLWTDNRRLRIQELLLS